METSFRKLLILLLAIGIVSGCSSYDPKDALTETEQARLLSQLSPYVHKKPDELSFDERFSAKAINYYKKVNAKTDSRLMFFKESDSVNFFFFTYRDLTSLYEHYRGMGGYFKSDESGMITFVNLLYHTPRFTSEELDKKALDLFDEMVTSGNVNSYLGNRDYIHTPNDDFYYDVTRNRWDYTQNSTWKFLKEEQERHQASK